MTSARPAPDLEAEAEVDVAGYARAIALRWWLLLVGLVAGALIGYASTLGGAQLYRASAVVYLGQPLGALSQTIQSLNTNPSAVKTIVTSQSAAEQAARKSGLRPGQIRSGVLVNQVAGSLSKVGQSPLVQITVKGSQKTKVRLAANALAAIVVNKLSGPARAKIAIFQPGADRDRAVIASVEEALAHPRDLNFTDKLLLQTRLQKRKAFPCGIPDPSLRLIDNVSVGKPLNGSQAGGIPYLLKRFQYGYPERLRVRPCHKRLAEKRPLHRI